MVRLLRLRSASRIAVNSTYISQSTASKHRTLSPSKQRRRISNSTRVMHKSLVQHYDPVNVSTSYNSSNYTLHDPQTFQLLSEHIMNTESPVDYAAKVNEHASIPDMSSIDTEELLRKLKEDMAQLESRSLATSIEERHAELLNTDASDEATARRRMLQLDSIVEGLMHDHLRPGAPWGFVVFRTVYGPESDAPFARMMEQLRDIDETLSCERQQYLAPHYELTIIEDEKTLAGADSHAVRDAFRAWVADDLTPRFKDTEKWGGEAEVHKMLRSNVPMSDPSWNNSPYHPATTMPARWQFCLFVDEICLRSLEEADTRSGPYVKLLNADWQGDKAEVVAEGWEDGETEDENEDVGWMYMDVSEHVETYRDFMDPYSWWEVPLYQRPYKGFIP